MTTDKQGTGRPRERRVDHAILSATREILVESGYAGLTLDAVTTRAGTGKAAIYRRYATRQELVFAATVHDLTLEIPPDAGSLTADLTVLINDILATLGNQVAMVAIPGLLHDITADPDLAGRFERTFLAQERACITAVLDRAVERGELTEPPDLDVVHALLVGPVFAWLYLFRRPERQTFSRDLAARLTAAIT